MPKVWSQLSTLKIGEALLSTVLSTTLNSEDWVALASKMHSFMKLELNSHNSLKDLLFILLWGKSMTKEKLLLMLVQVLTSQWLKVWPLVLFSRKVLIFDWVARMLKEEHSRTDMLCWPTQILKKNTCLCITSWLQRKNGDAKSETVLLLNTQLWVSSTATPLPTQIPSQFGRPSLETLQMELK